MTQTKIKINQPHLNHGSSEAQLTEATTRIHNRFQGILVSMIESAAWGNWKLTKNPVEAHHPIYEEAGRFADLILKKRGAEIVALMEVKTKWRRYDDPSVPSDVLGGVLDDMGPKLVELQQAARAESALWIVAVGVYRAQPMSAASSWATDFDVIMAWGRGVGIDSIKSSYTWQGLNMLDTSMKDMLDPYQFWSVKTPITVNGSRPLLTPTSAQPMTQPRTAPTLWELPSAQGENDLKQIIQSSDFLGSEKAALMAALNWGDQMAPMSRVLPAMEHHGYQWRSVLKSITHLARQGLIEGHRPGGQSHRLRVNRDKLLEMIRKP